MRIDPDPDGSELGMLPQYLDYQRETMLSKTDGLTREQLARKHSPSGLTLAGLLSHLSLVEEDWMEVRFTGLPDREPWAGVDWNADPIGSSALSARYYDPALGRFTQQDPSGQDANPYTYAGNDPINHIDPNGLDFWSAAAGVIVAGIAGIGVAAVSAGNPVAVGIAVGATCGAVDSMSSGGDLENIATEAFAGAFIGGVGAMG